MVAYAGRHGLSVVAERNILDLEGCSVVIQQSEVVGPVLPLPVTGPDQVALRIADHPRLGLRVHFPGRGFGRQEPHALGPRALAEDGLESNTMRAFSLFALANCDSKA